MLIWPVLAIHVATPAHYAPHAALPHCASLQRQRGANFTLGYRLHSTLPGRGAAAAPGARRMQSFRFGGVDTPYGQFRIAVDFQPASTVTILEQTTSPPALPCIIADYVGGGGGSGMGGAREPLRHALSASAFPGAPSPQQQALSSSPAGGALPGSSPRPGGMPIRRSWSSSLRGASPGRTLPQSPREPPSPVSAHDTPYGSAPQAVRARPCLPSGLDAGCCCCCLYYRPAARLLARFSPSDLVPNIPCSFPRCRCLPCCAR